MNIGLLIMRLVIGLTLAAHGTQKLFGWFGGHGIAGTGGFLEQLGFRPGKLHALMAGLVETGGGVLLAAGLLAPLGSAAMIAVMIIAGGAVHLKNGFFLQKNGYEYTFVLAGVSAALAFTGPGAYSFDAALGLAWSGWTWGLFALVLGIVGGVANLAMRSTAPVASPSS